MVDRVSTFNFVKPFQTSSDPIFPKDPITLKKTTSVFKNTLEDTHKKKSLAPSFHKRLTTIVPLGPEFPINTYITNNQENPVVAKLTNGNIAVIWAGEGIGDIDGIFGTVLNPDGTQNSTEFRANTDSYDSKAIKAAMEDPIDFELMKDPLFLTCCGQTINRSTADFKSI